MTTSNMTNVALVLSGDGKRYGTGWASTLWSYSSKIVVDGVAFEATKRLAPDYMAKTYSWRYSLSSQFGEPDRDRCGNDIGGDIVGPLYGPTPEAALAAFMDVRGSRRCASRVRLVQSVARKHGLVIVDETSDDLPAWAG